MLVILVFPSSASASAHAGEKPGTQPTSQVDRPDILARLGSIWSDIFSKIHQQEIPGQETRIYLPITLNNYPAPVETIVVSPDQGGSFYSSDGSIEVSFPPGAVNTMVTISYQKKASPGNLDGSLRFAEIAFSLKAFDASGNPVAKFDQPYTLVLHYSDESWQNAGVGDENTLKLILVE